jgi:2-hydroxy-3-oxopropionate reductase
MERIGFIGLGIMGQPMAGNLIKTGYRVTVYNRSQAPMDRLADQGAAVATSAKALAQGVDVVITCVPDSPDVEALMLGPDGILEGMRPGMLYIDMSTIAASVSRRIATTLAAHGVQALDAPVSGGDIGAQAGTLSIMVGGDPAAFDRALPILQGMGENIVHVGEAGAGQIAKACNQVVVALTVQAVTEALALAQRSGVDPLKVRQALLGGFANSRVLEVHGQKMLDRDFQPGFKLNLFRKDMNLVLQTSRELGLPLLGAHQVVPLMDALIGQGQGELDFAALWTLYEQLGHFQPDSPEAQP